jgi:hypothetical protein
MSSKVFIISIRGQICRNKSNAILSQCLDFKLIWSQFGQDLVSVPVGTLTTDFIASSAFFGSACTSSTRRSRLNIDFYKFLCRISESCHIIHWCTVFSLHSSFPDSGLVLMMWWWCSFNTSFFWTESSWKEEESWNEWPINCYIGPRRAWVTLMKRDSLFIIYTEGHLRKHIALHAFSSRRKHYGAKKVQES